MGADEEVFTTVDALFTAVTAHDEKLLGDCEQRLHAYRDAGKLPGDAADYLDGPGGSGAHIESDPCLRHRASLLPSVVRRVDLSPPAGPSRAFRPSYSPSTRTDRSDR